MQDWLFRHGHRQRLINWMGLDSKIDSTLAETWAAIRNWWNAGSSFFARFKITGWRRLANEAASEVVSMAAGGLVVMYALAIPALNEFDEGRFLTGQFAVKFLDQNGNEIGKRGILHNDAVPLEEIPDVMVKATLATEDRRFFEHWGIDVVGTFRALFTNLQANEVVQGGSSITQQVAKNLFLSSERSIQRKIKEAFLAMLLESRFTKRQILKLYFDRAYMGGGAFGVEAASQYYFGKSVRQVTMAEAAMLAGLFKAPTRFAPHINLPASRARTNEVLTNMVEAGFYTSGQVHQARVHPAVTVETRNPNSPDWFLDWAFEEVQRIAAGRNQYVLTARTTVDLNMQKATDEALTAALKQYRGNHITSGAIVLMETDGAVKALTGGPDYGESQFNRATHALRQPGSSFKVYVYATALENGFKPNTTVRDASRSCGRWHPQNYGGSHGGGGSMPLWNALARSLNTVAAELSFKVGREKVIEMTRRLGIDGIKKTCSMALGDYGIAPIQHAGGVGTFANGGKLAKPYAILDLVNSKGELIYSRDRDEPPAPQVYKRELAEQMNFMLNKVITEGTGQRAQLDFTNVAGKTGTSTGPKDAWFVGFTGKYVGVVWLGNDDNRPMAGGTTGGVYAAPIWHSFMSVVHTDMNIPTIPGLPPHPVQVAEQQRIAALRSEDTSAPVAGEAGEAAAAPRSTSLMSDQTRDALKRLAQAMRKAAGLSEPAAEPASQSPPGAPAPQLPPDKRAQVNPSRIDETPRRAVP
ncbi:MAG TPA: PBP1A family penicillin-binding protein [Hyphomicrobium sp.]